MKVGEEVDVVGLREAIQKTVVTGVEMFRKELDEGIAGDNVGLLLRGMDKDKIERGMVLAKRCSITPHKNSRRKLYSNPKKRAAVIHRSLKDIVLSFISEPPT